MVYFLLWVFFNFFLTYVWITVLLMTVKSFQDLVLIFDLFKTWWGGSWTASSLVLGFTPRPLASAAAAGSSVLLGWHQILGLSAVPTSQVPNMGFRTWAGDSCWSWGRVAVWCGNWIGHEISLMDSSPGVCWGGPGPLDDTDTPPHMASTSS